MAYRPLEINVISAKHLKDVNFISKMDVYTVVSISADDSLKKTKQKFKTHVDRSGGSNPTWNSQFKFTIDESLAKQNRPAVVFKIKSESLLGDKDVGEVTVPVKELLDSAGDGKSMKFVSYQVRKPSGKARGELHFSYKFGDIISSPAAVSGATAGGDFKANEPVTAYPAPAAMVGSSSTSYVGHAPYPPPPAAGYAYPPPPGAAPYSVYPPPPAGKQGNGYPPPPPNPGYGYPPPPHPGYPYPPPGGYGYPAVQQPAKKNKFGMGLGAGLLGGMLGGLLIGDIVSDAADCGFDGGFDGGFDF